MKNPLRCILVLTVWCRTLAAQTPAQSVPPLLPEFLWSGSWESRHNLTDRFDFKLTALEHNLVFRLQVLDRRPASTAEAFTGSFGGDTADKALTQPGLGLYHTATGSRLLYGMLDHQGLSTRIRNVWIRGAPYEESRTASQANLKTAPASTATAQTYARLGSPDLNLGPGNFQAFAFCAFADDEERAPAFGAGTDYTVNKTNIHLEGFYTQRTLPPRTVSAWFSEKPPLPERDTRLFAGTAAFSVPAFGIAADMACSETFAFGRDFYGNVGLRFGDKPWRFSLAVDGAGSRYVDPSGAVPGSGLRAAARLERRSKRQGLFRLGALVRGPGPEAGFEPALAAGDFASLTESFNRSSLELYGRLPTPKTALALSRFSLSWDRDSRNTEKILDTAKAMTAFKLGPVNTVSEGKINWSHGAYLSHKISQSVSWTFRNAPPGTKSKSALPGKTVLKAAAGKVPFTLDISAKAGCEKTTGKTEIWDLSASASIHGKQSRLTIKAATPKFPEKWEYTLSWRLQW